MVVVALSVGPSLRGVSSAMIIDRGECVLHRVEDSGCIVLLLFNLIIILTGGE